LDGLLLPAVLHCFAIFLQTVRQNQPAELVLIVHIFAVAVGAPESSAIGTSLQLALVAGNANQCPSPLAGYLSSSQQTGFTWTYLAT